MTRLGLGSYGVAWAVGVPGYEPPADPVDAFGLLQQAHNLGLRLVQIADNLPLHTLTDTERERLRAKAQALDIAIEVGTRGIQPAHLAQYLALAQFFASPILRVVVDSDGHHPTPDEVIEMLRPQLPAFAQAGVVLAIENHDRFKAKTLVELLTALDHPNVGICLDTVNSFGSLEGPEVVVEALAPYVVNLHIKEFVVRRAGHAMGFEITGRPTGQGMLDLPWLLGKLAGRSFNAIIEAWLPMQITLAETVAMEARWARQSVAYLRQYIKD